MAVGTFGIGKWDAISKYVGHGRTNEQCGERWRKHVSPLAVERKRVKQLEAARVPPKKIRRPRWTEEEVCVCEGSLN